MLEGWRWGMVTSKEDVDCSRTRAFALWADHDEGLEGGSQSIAQAEGDSKGKRVGVGTASRTDF